LLKNKSNDSDYKHNIKPFDISNIVSALKDSKERDKLSSTEIELVKVFDNLKNQVKSNVKNE
jgi:predicted transcriptional regulator